MQIRASRRQSAAQLPRPHLVLARRWALQRRLVTGGVVALVLSVLAWFFGLSLPLHLGLVGVGFAAGFLWRFARVRRDAEHWAFSWIEARAGLSYLTAHELPTDTKGNAKADTEVGAGGFGAAVRARAAQVGRLETPALQPWALPLLVLALAFAALPHLGLPTLRAPFSPLTEQLLGTLPEPSAFKPPAPEAPAPDAEPEVAATPEQVATPDTVSAPETDAATSAGDAATDDPGIDNPGAGNIDAGRSFDDAGAVPEGDAAEGERAALDQFLKQNSQNGLEQNRTQTDPSRSGSRDGEPSGQNSNQSEPGTGDTPREAQSGQNAPNTTSDSDSSDEGAGNDKSGAGSSAEREAAPNQDAGQEGTGQGTQAEAPDSENEDGGQAGSDDPTSSSQAEPGDTPQPPQSGLEQTGRQDDPAARQGGSDGQRSAAPNEGSETSQNPQDGATSERAGTKPGNDVESSRERLGAASQSAPERITGAREDGPTSFSGEALRQGDAPDTLPQTGDADYRRAAEEVIREGRIPLEYQEVIRDYFR